jgi:2-oxoglutarate ferredoxin oxidoreductase subunit alpha
VEAFNLAERYQLPVIIISDLLVSEHPETIEPESLSATVSIDRGELVTEWNADNGNYKRYAFTPSGISPRALPGTPNTIHVAATDEHDEEGIVISDVFTNPAVRRKMAEKRLRKLDLALGDLPAPQLSGPADAEVTLIGWGSTQGVIREAVGQLAAAGIRANHLQVKYLFPFHAREVSEILRRSKRTICIEANATGQFARHLRAETGTSVDDRILKYDGEPFEPHEVTERVRAILEGRPHSLDVTLAEAREIAYHYVRTRLNEEVRPGGIEKADGDGHGEAVWRIEVVHRDTGKKQGELRIGVETGSTYSWQPSD